MLGVHNDNAPSNIIEIFARFSNNHIYTTRSEKSELFSVKLSRLKIQRPICLLVSKSGMRSLLNICQRNPSKKENCFQCNFIKLN